MPSVNVTCISDAFSTTWLLVTIKPSSDITKPEPNELNSRSDGSDLGILNGKLKKSSIDGTSGPVCSITPVVEILTTDGDTLSAKSENVSGPVKADVSNILLK